jgi:hypothetical protein
LRQDVEIFMPVELQNLHPYLKSQMSMFVNVQRVILFVIVEVFG